MNAIIITIGDELLIGQVIDTNSAWISEQLNIRGVDVSEILTISDQHQHIVDTITYASQKTNMLIITGGLGPTRDDITKVALADYLQVGMEYNDTIYNHIVALFKQINKPATDIIKDQCYFPKDTEIVNNNMGTAPGMWMTKGLLHILSVPGVPYEMKYIMEHGGFSKIDKLSGDKTSIYHRTIRTAAIGEDNIASKIDEVVNSFPDHIKIAFLPSLWEVRIRLSGYSEDEKKLKEEVQYYENKIVTILGNDVYGYDNDTLSAAIGRLLINKNYTLSTAESCTAGLVGHTIALTPGSSAYYQGTIVSYSNDVKMNILGVRSQTLDKEGAVSQQTVEEMLLGVLETLNTDVAISISGIAGPGGGTPDKPVGTIWIAYGSMSDIRTMRININKDRQKNMQIATTMALNLLRIFLMEEK